MTDNRYGKIHTDGSRSGGQPLNDSIEAKALALVNEVQADWNYQLGSLAFKRDRDIFSEALCRAIEQHEAFRQEVSDAVEEYKADQPYVWKHNASDYFSRFIIPKPKPDPLVEAMSVAMCGVAGEDYTDSAAALRHELAKHGLKIVEVSDGQG